MSLIEGTPQKSAVISLKVQPRTRRQLIRLAHRQGMSLSEFMRKLAERHVAAHGDPEPIVLD